jgi:hypothetical protein
LPPPESDAMNAMVSTFFSWLCRSFAGAVRTCFLSEGQGLALCLCECFQVRAELLRA